MTLQRIVLSAWYAACSHWRSFVKHLFQLLLAFRVVVAESSMLSQRIGSVIYKQQLLLLLAFLNGIPAHSHSLSGRDR